ncbi:MAG: hypothetical protein PUC83_06520 [Fibrobacter sp.]|nr:hypothetical protein [Fibrobacter sp.]MDD5942283.1 hypothetical protein [Fibrobacter sp.]
MDYVSPETLGALIAMYEHKILQKILSPRSYI